MLKKTRVEFRGSCLKQGKVTYNHEKIVNICIVIEISKNYNISSYPTLKNCLCGVVTLNKNADIDQSGYGIRFDRKGDFSVTHEVGTNVIIFGVDMSLSPHIDNKKNI